MTTLEERIARAIHDAKGYCLGCVAEPAPHDNDRKEARAVVAVLPTADVSLWTVLDQDGKPLTTGDHEVYATKGREYAESVASIVNGKGHHSPRVFSARGLVDAAAHAAAQEARELEFHRSIDYMNTENTRLDDIVKQMTALIDEACWCGECDDL